MRYFILIISILLFSISCGVKAPPLAPEVEPAPAIEASPSPKP